jgi:hypothetical protein
MRPNKSEQIEALISHEAVKLVEKNVPSQEWRNDAYKKIFTVKRNEILQYVKERYPLNKLVHTKEGNFDGFYAIQRVKGYEVFEQERGIKFNQTQGLTLDEVWSKYVDYLIRTSGTGLLFE